MMNIKFQADYTYRRLLPRLQKHYLKFASQHPEEWQEFLQRLDRHFSSLFITLFPLYGGVYDAIYYIEKLLFMMAESWISRPSDLKDLDKKREANPFWFQSEQMVGGVVYVDLFSGNIEAMHHEIQYLNELGINYLHLMPLFKTPEGENDGGYAVSSYREINSEIGTIQQLRQLATEMRRNGISLVLDFVFNHTSNEHEWALRARQGDPFYQNYYWIFEDRNMPDAFEANLREIFPDEHTGTFTYFKSIQKWVWTTFHSYQWDLNYQNPAVFVSMAEEMLFLANLGVEVLRLDAVAFIWKKLGTNCENLPEAHYLIQAFNLIARIAAPALIFKSEAIVHPDDVIKYISSGECQISYNPLLMALLWESLATREVGLLKYSMQKRLAIPQDCTWVNYVRSHDDIGWTFSDDDASELWINGNDHRQFLNEFYRGRFPGSFAKGLTFQENQKTGDSRISGTCSSLAGLEKAIKSETDKEVTLAIKRILLIHGIILTIGGIPLIYLGDEIGTLNDYSYRDHTSKSNDSRWVHRSEYDFKKSKLRDQPKTIENRIFSGLIQLINLRKENPVFSNHKTEIVELKNPHVFCYTRWNDMDYVVVIVNFSETPQKIDFDDIPLRPYKTLTDLDSKKQIISGNMLLTPYDFKCIKLS